MSEQGKEPRKPGAGYEENAPAKKPPRKDHQFNIHDCKHPDLVLQVSEAVMAFTVGIAGQEYYTLRDGRFFRIAGPDELPHAVYPKATDQHPYGVPLRAVVIQDMSDAEYAELRAGMAPAPARGARGPDWVPPA